MVGVFSTGIKVYSTDYWLRCASNPFLFRGILISDAMSSILIFDKRIERNIREISSFRILLRCNFVYGFGDN